MKFFKTLICVFMAGAFVYPVHALVVRSGEDVVVSEEEILDDDLIVFAKNADIRGTVDGDVFAFAQTVEVSGSINGALFCGGATVDVAPTSVRTIWAGGADVKIAGDISKNAILAGGSLIIAENTALGKDLTVFGGNFTMRGEVSGCIKGGVGDFTMSGKAGCIDINADEITIKSNAVIHGDCIVKSEEPPVIEEGAVISGETRIKEITEEDEEVAFELLPVFAFFYTLFKVVSFVAAIIIGVLLISLAKKFVRRVMDTLIQKPWASLGWGFLGLIVIPVAIVILFMIMIGWPLAVFGIYVYTILFYLSSIFVGMVVGEKVIRLFKKEGEISLYLSFIVGFLLLTLVGLIPVLGLIVTFVVLLFGAGMLLLGSWNLMKDLQKNGLI